MKINRDGLLNCKDYTEAANKFKNITKDKNVTNCHFFMDVSMFCKIIKK